MMDWFNSREPRERVLLMILGGLLALFLAWFALTRESGPNGAEALEAAQADHTLWLKAAPRLGNGASAGTRETFTRGALIENARRRNVDLSRVQAQPDGGLTLWVEDAPTTALYGLLADLAENYAVDVQTAVISTSPAGGLNAQIGMVPVE